MIVATTEKVAGYRTTESLGQVFGVVVRSRGLGGNIVMLDGHREWRADLWDEALGNPRLPSRDDLTWFPY